MWLHQLAEQREWGKAWRLEGLPPGAVVWEGAVAESRRGIRMLMLLSEMAAGGQFY